MSLISRLKAVVAGDDYLDDDFDEFDYASEDEFNEMNDFKQIFSGLKLITDYLDKSILRPNNISHPRSRIDFLNIFKD